jgi:hypothetical protein
MMRWVSSEEPTKGPREWCAASDGSEYRIRGPVLGNSDPATRTVAEYYTVLRCRTGARSGEVASAVGMASERVGEAPTLKEAKAMAQRHADGGESDAEKPEVRVNVTTFEHPDCTRIEIVIPGDEHQRSLIKTAILMAIDSLKS